jgi:hypothetical protein
MKQAQQALSLLDFPEEIILHILSHLFRGPCVLDRYIAKDAVSLQHISILSVNRRLHDLAKSVMRSNFSRTGLELRSITLNPKELGLMASDSQMKNLLSFLRQYQECFQKVTIVNAFRTEAFLERLDWWPNLKRVVFRGQRFQFCHVVDGDDEVCKTGVLEINKAGKICTSWLNDKAKGLLEARLIERLMGRAEKRYSIGLEVVVSVKGRQGGCVRWLGRWVSAYAI